MLDLSIGELAEITEGKLLWSELPPLGGQHEPVRRAAFDTRRVTTGDVLWCLSTTCWDHPAASADAFRRGGCGVVGERFAAPWAGTFSLRVDDACEALRQVARHKRLAFQGKVIGVSAGRHTAIACRMVAAALSVAAPTHLCSVLRRRGECLASGLLHLPETCSYCVVPVFDLQKPNILQLSAPHVAVITPAAQRRRQPLAQQIEPWLPASSEVLDAESPRDAALAVANRFGIDEFAAEMAIDRAALRPKPIGLARAA